MLEIVFFILFYTQIIIFGLIVRRRRSGGGCGSCVQVEGEEHTAARTVDQTRLMKHDFIVHYSQ
jgi:hypothetical protein